MWKPYMSDFLVLGTQDWYDIKYDEEVNINFIFKHIEKEVYTVIFDKIVFHLNSVDSRYIFDACSVHFMRLVALSPKDRAVIKAVPLFKWENPYIKITTPLHVLGEW